MPLARRVPKRGFNNARFATEYQVVNVGSLALKFESGEVSVKELYDARLVRSMSLPVKLLAKGDVNKSFTIKVNAASESARQKIEAAGGKVEVV
jgi:large subunit ribosomal protein L15